MPPPQETERLQKKKRVNEKRRGKTTIPSSSPYKADFEAMERDKNAKQNEQKRKMVKKPTELKSRHPKVKKEKKIKKIKTLCYHLMRNRIVTTLAFFIVNLN